MIVWFLHTSVGNLIFSTLDDLCLCLFFLPRLGSLLLSRSSAILSRDFPVKIIVEKIKVLVNVDRIEFMDFLIRHSNLSNLINERTDWCDLLRHKYHILQKFIKYLP